MKAKLLKKERIEEAWNDYIKDENFKEQNAELKKTASEFYKMVLGFKDYGVDPVIERSNKIMFDNMDMFSLLVMPRMADIFERIKYYSQKDDPESKERLKHLELLKNLATDTAYIMPTANKDKQLSYFVTVGQDLHDKMKEWGYSEGEMAKAINFAAFHEFTHFLRGDVNPWRSDRLKETHPNLEHGDWNILEDATINSNGLRQFYEDAAALLDKIGIRGSTVASFLSPMAVLQAAYDFKDKEFDADAMRQKILEHYKNLGITNATEEDVMQFSEKYLKVLHDKMKSIGSFDEFFKDLHEKWQGKIEDFKNGKLIGESTRLPNSFIDIASFVANNTRAFENGSDNMLLMDTWADYLNKAKSLMPGQGGGDGEKKEGEPDTGKGPVNGIPQDHANEHTSANPDDYEELGEKDIEREVGRIDKRKEDIEKKVEEEFNRHNKDYGALVGQKQEKQLELTKNEAVYRALKAALQETMRAPIEILKRKVLPIINGPLNHIKQITDYTRTKAGKSPISAPPPKGVLATTKDIKYRPTVVLFLMDESASMSDDMIAAAKTAISEICKEKNLMLVSLSTAHGMKPEPSVYNPKEQPPEDFVKRQVSGGTDHPLEDLLNFVDLVKNDKEFREKLGTELAKAKTNITLDDVDEMLKNGELVAVAVTDGAIPSMELKDEDKEFLDKIVKNGKQPLKIVSYYPVTGNISNLSPEEQNKYVGILLAK